MRRRVEPRWSVILLAQLASIVVMALVAVRQHRAIVHGSSIRPEPFAERFHQLLFARPDRARQLAERARASWVGRLATTSLDALDAGRDVGLEMAAEYRQIRQDAYEPLRLLRQLARGCVFLGLLCAMAEVVWARFAPQSLDALVAGVAEARGEANAVLLAAIGFASATVILSLRRGLRRLVHDTLPACDKFRETLENQVLRRIEEGWTLQEPR